MNQAIQAAGRVCLCEWSGPVTVTMAASLRHALQQFEGIQGGSCILVLNLGASSARSILKQSCTFHDVVPALWACCQEVVITCDHPSNILEQLRQALCGSQSARVGTITRPLSFFALLDDAFEHTKKTFPHDVLELQRRRIRSGTWSSSKREPRAT